MSDNLINFAHARFVDPNKPNLYAAHTMADGQIAQFGRILNMASLGGAAQDLPTRNGVPRIGYRGGIYCVDDANSYWSKATPVPVTAAASAYVVQVSDIFANPTAVRYFLVNGSVGGYDCRVDVNGVISITFDRATLSSSAINFGIGKGPMRVAGIYDGANQSLMINGVIYDTDAVVPAAPNGFFALGQHGSIDLDEVYSAQRTVAQERADYVREFAKRVLHSITPSAVGEGPAGGILTGAVGEGDWFCPSGGATLQHVWRNDLSVPGGGRLVLTDTGVTQRRLAYMHPRAPSFGTWIVRYEVRDPLTDSLQFALSPTRDADYTAAGSGCYWVHLRRVAGPWWRASLYYENGAQIDAVDTPLEPVVGDRGVLLLTRHVDGSWQIYNYLQSLRSWYWSVASPVDVTGLSSNYFVVSPRGAYVEGHTRLQGEATPHELELAVP